MCGKITYDVLGKISQFNFPIPENYFSFDNLYDYIQETLRSTSVSLQGRSFNVRDLLDEDALSTIPVSALLDWYPNRYKEQVIGYETCDQETVNDSNNESCASEDFYIPNSLEMSFESISVLIGLPGSGKSCLLSRMVRDLQQKFEKHIVIKANCSQIITLTDMIKLVSKSLNCPIDYFQAFILQKMVQNRQIILLLDGFDELGLKKNKENVITMLEWIQLMNLKVLIATRPHRVQFLKDNLKNPTIYSMRPFASKDQLCFLGEHFKNVPLNKILESCHTLFDDAILEIPLHCSILAYIFSKMDLYKDQIDDITWDVARIFQKFFNQKFKLFTTRFLNPYSNAHQRCIPGLWIDFTTGHSELAFKMDTSQVIEDECFEKFESYGLLRNDDGNVSFISPSFKDFFLTLYLVSYYVEQPIFNRYLLECFYKSKVNRFDIFLEHHIRKGTMRKLENAIPPAVLESVFGEYRILPQTCWLHSDKIKQFHVFFVECCTVEEQMNYLRTSIIKGQFGIFEIIYQSLPISLIDAIRFTFTSNADDIFAVDLSMVSENNLQEILMILHRQHPWDIVEKVIVESNQEDFIAIAIKHNYQNVICCLFTIFYQNQSGLLLEYLEKRWQQYLMLLIEYDRDNLLTQVFNLISEKFHPRVIKQFLMNRSSQVFIEMYTGEKPAEVVQQLFTFIERYLTANDFIVLVERLIA